MSYSGYSCAGNMIAADTSKAATIRDHLHTGLTTMALDIRTRKNLKALGHKLNPVVMVAGKGLSDAVLEEVRRALHDHELIKVKFAIADRAMKQQVIAEMCTACNCELVQQIGHIALVYKENTLAKPNLSNVRSWT